jgi:hypothetical protein
MNIIYEKIEDYIKMLKTRPTDAVVFVSNISSIAETGYIKTSIILQVLLENDCMMFKHSQDMPVFKLAGDGSFSAIPDETIRASAQKSYSDSYDAFIAKQNEEYSKMVGLLTGMGFTNIENALVQ